jgi:UDP-glucose:glycoprotein glucosyltransferase
LSFSFGKEDAPLYVDCFLNPNTKAFPKLVILFSKLAELGFLGGTVSLNPSLKVVDYMYRDFYSLGELPELLPPDLEFSVKLDGPSAWITTVKESAMDPDNMTVKGGKVTFEVKHLVIEGQYVDKEKSSPAQGVQLELRQRSDLSTSKAVEKTLVMASYGYFQFKCQPAVYELTSPFEAEKRLMVVKGFSVTSRLIKATLPKEWYHQVLDKLAQDDVEEEADTLNVFSIASGESYERMLRIMMTSVSLKKRGHNKLKFWLFDAFVSPAFRTSIQQLSQRMKFEYEFLSYKWPLWLLTQKRKLRTVWAYKILFLDVIFPRNVGRVIFVDADQVARADLTELAVMDMEDQVYGFVPFCEDRPDMASYRFWNTPGSYWEQQLQGKPYYIRYSFINLN